MKHGIFGLGVLLLELQKNRSFCDVPGLEQGWRDIDGQRLKHEFLKLLFLDSATHLGNEFVSPIAQMSLRLGSTRHWRRRDLSSPSPP